MKSVDGGLLTALFSLVVTCLMPVALARAQVAAAAYEDAKNIIEELVTTEIARTAVSETVCRAGHIEEADSKLPSVIHVDGKYHRLELLHYFPNTLHQLYVRQFVGLRTSVRTEAAELAGYLFYQGLRRLTLSTAETDLLVAQWTSKKLTEAERNILIRDLATRVSGEESQREFASLLEKVGAAMPPGVSPSVHQGLAREAQKFIGIDTSAAPNGVVFGKFKDHQGCLDKVKAKFESGAILTQRVSPLDHACSNRATFGGDLECELALGVRSALLGSADETAQHIEGAAQILIGVALRKLMIKLDASLKERLIGERVVEVLNDLVKQPGRSQSAASLIARALAVSEAKGADLDARARELEAELRAIAGALERLSARWASIRRNSANGMSLAVFIDELVGDQGPFALICKGIDLYTCKRFDAIREKIVRGGQFWPVIQAAANRDMRGLARAAIAAVFDPDPDPDPDSAPAPAPAPAAAPAAVPAKAERSDGKKAGDSQRDLYRRFVESLVLYAIDMAEGSSPSTEARVAFRAATLEVIREISPGGIDRKYRQLRARDWWRLLLPDFMLRASWSSAYVNDDGSNFRYVVAAPMGHVRLRMIRTPSVYLYAHISLLDPVAPLSELALRTSTFDGRAVGYSDDELLGWNVITPRLEAAFGLPSLSRHLVLTMGASFRPAVPYLTNMLSSDPVQYEYRIWRDSGTEIGRHIELGVSVKYIP